MTTKFLWGDLRASPPQLFGHGGDRPHGVGAYAYNCSKEAGRSENKKLSYRFGTTRLESLPNIAEMDVETKTYAEMTFKCTSRSSKVAPIES